MATEIVRIVNFYIFIGKIVNFYMVVYYKKFEDKIMLFGY